VLADRVSRVAQRTNKPPSSFNEEQPQQQELHILSLPHSLLGTFPQGSKHRVRALSSKGPIPGAKYEKPATEPARKNASCATGLTHEDDISSSCVLGGFRVDDNQP